MAVNQNVIWPLTAEERKNAPAASMTALRPTWSFAGTAATCARRICTSCAPRPSSTSSTPAARSVPTAENRSGRSATRWARRPASSSSDTHTKRLPHNGGSLFYGTVRGKTPHFGTRNKNMVPKTHRVCYSDDNLAQERRRRHNGTTQTEDREAGEDHWGRYRHHDQDRRKRARILLHGGHPLG